MSPKFFSVFKRKFVHKCEKDNNNEIIGNTFYIPDNFATQTSKIFYKTTDQKNLSRTKYKKKTNKNQYNKNETKGRHVSLNEGDIHHKLSCNNCKEMQHTFKRNFSNVNTANVNVNNSVVVRKNPELYKKTGVKSKCKCQCKRSKKSQANSKIYDSSRKNRNIEGISLNDDCYNNMKYGINRKGTKIYEDPIEGYEYDNDKIECNKKQHKGDFESPLKLSNKTKTCPRTERRSEISFDSDIRDINEKYSKKKRCTCISELKYKTKLKYARPNECRLDNNINGDISENQKLFANKTKTIDSSNIGGFHKQHNPNQFCDGQNIKAGVKAPERENKRDEIKCSCTVTREQTCKNKTALPEYDPCKLDNDVEEDISKNKIVDKDIRNKRKKNISNNRCRCKNFILDRFKKYGENDQTEDNECPCTLFNKRHYTPALEQSFHRISQGVDSENFDGNLIKEQQNSHVKLEKFKRELEKILKELKETQSKSRNNRCCNEKCGDFTDQNCENINGKERELYSKICDRGHKINKFQDSSNDIEEKCSLSISNADLYCDTESCQSADQSDCNNKNYSEQISKFNSRDVMTKAQDCNNKADEISNNSFSNTERCTKSYQFDSQSAASDIEGELEQHIGTCSSRKKMNKLQDSSSNSNGNIDRFCNKKSHHISCQSPDNDLEDETGWCINTSNPKGKINKDGSNYFKENCNPSYPNPRGSITSRSSVSYYGAQTSSSDLGNTTFSRSCCHPNLQPNCFSNSTTCDDNLASRECDEDFIDSINKLIMKGPGLLKNAIKCLCPRGILENLQGEDLEREVKWYKELKDKQEHELVSCFKNRPIGCSNKNLLKSKKFATAGLKFRKYGHIIPLMKGIKLSLRHMSKPFI